MPDTTPWVTEPLPHLTADQMREVDRLMVEEYRIDAEQMMEHAGRHLAHLARTRFLGGDPRDRSVVVLAGTGGNGGGALVAARRLHGWGAQVRVFVTGLPERFLPVARRQLEILPLMAVTVAPPRSQAPKSPRPHALNTTSGANCGRGHGGRRPGTQPKCIMSAAEPLSICCPGGRAECRTGEGAGWPAATRS